MKTENDEIVLDNWKLPHRNYIVKMRKDDGFDDGCDVKIILPSRLGAFILCNCKRIVTNIIREIIGFFNSNIYY